MTALQQTSSPLAALQPRPQKPLVMLILGGLVAGSIALATFYGWQQGILLLVGGLFGATLYHAGFGFASSYRKLFVYGEVRGVLAQMVMLTVVTLLFAPFLVTGQFEGSLAPVAVQAVIGALLFGVGMQLGSGCACGTLYAIGGGSSMMLLTLLTFGLGSFWASLTGAAWAGLPRTAGPISLAASLGWGGVGIQLAVIGLCAAGLWWWGRRNGEVMLSVGLGEDWQWRSLFYGPWSLVSGGILLAVLNWVTLLVAGRPWGVTWGFTLWTAKIAQSLGWDPDSSFFWVQDFPRTALESSLWGDITSVMNIGIVLGASLAASLAGRMSVRQPPSRLGVVGALLGGILMGYGASLAFGCNVGAYFSGIASTSLHGWLWIVFALIGSAVGVRLRPWFHLSN